MAVTSGRINGNAVEFGAFYFCQWQLINQEISNNRSQIAWQAYWHFDGNDSQLDNGDCAVNGSYVWDNPGRVYNYTGNIRFEDMLLASGSTWVNHNADGSKVFDMGGSCVAVAGQGSGAGFTNFTLPTIPRASQPTLSDTTLNSDQNVTMYTNRASGSFTHTVQLKFGALVKTIATGVHTSLVINMNDHKADMGAIITSQNTGGGNITIKTYNGGTYLGEKYVDFSYVMINANPVFTIVGSKDTNATTVAITGDDTKFIQNESTLESTILVADKMTTKFSASAVRYESTVNGIKITQPFSATVDRTFSHGVINSGANLSQVVNAVDSRGNVATVNKTLTMIPYAKPSVNVMATRLNGFENDTTLEVSGSFSRLTIGGVDKNTVGTSAVEYRYKLNGGTWTAWTTMTRTVGTGTFDTTDIALSLDNSVSVDFEARATDELNTTTTAFTMSAGKPIFYIDKKRNSVAVGNIPTVENGFEINGRVLGVLGNTIYATSSSTWTKPDNLKYVDVEVVGGGGGGRGSQSGGRVANGGGGGGYAKARIMEDNLSSTESVTVGAGGSGGSAGNNAGSAGGTSSFGSLVVATGGGATTDDRTGGDAGVGTTGDFLLSGGKGGHYFNGSADAGGGGASFYAQEQRSGRQGGNSVAGIDGFAPGGGGNGGWGNVTSASGGDGADGIVIIKEYF